jgi:aspartokinase
MVTVSHLAEKIVEKRPFLEEALVRGIINYTALAEMLKPEIERELKKKVKTSAVIMALRRLSQKLRKSFVRQPRISFKETDVTIKSDLFETTVLKSLSVINNLKRLYDLMDFSRGDFLTITDGIHEVTIISNRRHKAEIEKILEKEKVIKTIDNLSSLTIKIPIEAVEQVGLFYVVTKALNWENINIIEIVSTLTEMTFILREDDISRAFNTIKRLIREQELEQINEQF